MSKFNVGDEVMLLRVENKYGQDSSEGWDLPMRVKILRTDEVYDFAVGTLDGKFLTHVDEKNIEYAPQQEAVVVKQQQYRVTIDDLSLQHTTGTKKHKVSIQRYGSKIGCVKFEEIDNLVELLLTLKENVNENV